MGHGLWRPLWRCGRPTAAATAAVPSGVKGTAASETLLSPASLAAFKPLPAASSSSATCSCRGCSWAGVQAQHGAHGEGGFLGHRLSCTSARPAEHVESCRIILVDCGEGTQHHIKVSTLLKLSRIEARIHHGRNAMSLRLRLGH
eukprot:s2524_g4.t1